MDNEFHDDPRVLLLSPQDNCLVACAALTAGTVLHVDSVPLTVTTSIGVGHKLARRGISAGEKLVRYGASIGTATQEISRGDHVHVHNLKSDYLPTFAVGEARLVTPSVTLTAENTGTDHG